MLSSAQGALLFRLCASLILWTTKKKTNAISINSLLNQDATNSPSYFSKIIRPVVLCLEEIHATQRKLLCFQHRGLEIQEADGTEMFGEFEDNLIQYVWSSNFTQTICCWKLFYCHWWKWNITLYKRLRGPVLPGLARLLSQDFESTETFIMQGIRKPKTCHSLSKSRKTTRRRRAFFEGTSDLHQGFSEIRELLPCCQYWRHWPVLEKESTFGRRFS